MSRRSTGPDAATVDAVMERDGGCILCSQQRGCQIHHRQPRQMGGTKDPAINSPSNLIVLCGDCHRRVESHRADAEAHGWIVRRPYIPSHEPILRRGVWVYLLDDGEVSETEPLFIQTGESNV
ncbi:HNH endonuclease [Stackebrandtia soli]|uniref:HNH endonuclease n=1 Tax=Stackebrandtia soli TaxID=1892856 RepID=UPI0039E8F140